MSDDEFMMDDAVDDFEYEDDEDVDDDPGPENNYYNAKAKKAEDPRAAIQEFESIVAAEDSSKSEWGWKSLKQLTKMAFRTRQYEKSFDYYKRLLTYVKSSVTRNVAEKSLSGILDYVSAEKNLDVALMEEWFAVTEKTLKDAKNERLSVRSNLKLAKLWFDRKEFTRLSKILKELKIACTPTAAEIASGEQDNTKATLLLEVMALEILMYTEQKNSKQLKVVYEQSLLVKAGISHPRIEGVIKECGGKMHMIDKEWSKAHQEFLEAFKSYDEAGSPQRIQVLKYLVLANMLMESEINPFDTQETKAFQNDPEIIAMTTLVTAYQHRDIHEAEKILKENRSTILSDSFIITFISDVLRSLRTSWILSVIKSYTRVELSFLAKQLKIPIEEVEDILLGLILDGRVKGKIDQVEQRLDLEGSNSSANNRYTSLSSLTAQIAALNNSMLSKAATSLGISGSQGPSGMDDEGFGHSSRWGGRMDTNW